jgi:hypothetical protein
MEGGPLREQWWIEMAKERFVPYLNISSRLPSTPDPNLLQSMGGRGFPYFVILDPDGERVVPGKAYPQFRPMNAAGTEAALSGVVELIRARVRAEREPDSPALAANRKLLERLLIDGKVSDIAAEAATKVEGVDPILAQRFRAQEVIVRYTFSVRPLERDDQEGRRAAFESAAREMLELHRSGPSLLDPSLRIFSDYCRLVFTGALLAGDVAVAEKTLGEYRRRFGSTGQMRERIDRMQLDLESLKKRLAESEDSEG